MTKNKIAATWKTFCGSFNGGGEKEGGEGGEGDKDSGDDVRVHQTSTTDERHLQNKPLSLLQRNEHIRRQAVNCRTLLSCSSHVHCRFSLFSFQADNRAN